VGGASFTVQNPKNGRTLSRSFQTGLRTGNAIRFAVHSDAKVSRRSQIALTVTQLDGAPATLKLATTEDGSAADVSAVYAGSSLQDGFTLTGTVTLTFRGEDPPRGERLNLTITAGQVACTGATLPPSNNQYTVIPDHLNTPRLLTDANQAIQWRWDNVPFGDNAPNQDPGQTGTQVIYNLRYPGQLYDAESQLHYNYFRDYDPVTGRYIESDPIGIDGGLNTYLYANASPLRFIDPSGKGILGGLACATIAAAGNIGDIKGISDALKKANETFDEIHRLELEKETCKDDKRKIDIDEEIQKLRQKAREIILKNAASDAKSGLIIVAAGIICTAIAPF
jgi:RHS repeat-associated protein